jgi:hypothetical protein
LVQFDCASVYRVSQQLIAVLDPDGCGCTGPRFRVLSSGFPVLPHVTQDSRLETEDSCTDDCPGLLTRPVLELKGTRSVVKLNYYELPPFSIFAS